MLDFSLLPIEIGNTLSVAQVLSYNETTKEYGLFFSEAQAKELIEVRKETLKQCGRIEFDTVIIKKLIDAFADSTFVSQNNYAQTIKDLIALFYAYKNESMDVYGDDELIAYMRHHFNHTCKGSLELLEAIALERFARSARFGYQGKELLLQEMDGINALEEHEEEAEYEP